jgi:hypothetical protein
MGLGGFLKGALPIAGGAAGFAIGGPPGAAIGSGLGGALSAQLGAGQRTGGPYAAVDPNLGLDPLTRQRQNAQIGRLQLQAMGKTPSMAFQAARFANDQGRAQLESMAVSDRRNPALARRNAMIQGGALSARLGQQAIVGRLQERQNAEMALAQAMSNAQAFDVNRAKITQGAYDTRYAAAMGQPTNFERGANVLASTLPMVGQLGQGQSPGDQLKAAQEADAWRKYQLINGLQG